MSWHQQEQYWDAKPTVIGKDDKGDDIWGAKITAAEYVVDLGQRIRSEASNGVVRWGTVTSIVEPQGEQFQGQDVTVAYDPDVKETKNTGNRNYGAMNRDELLGWFNHFEAGIRAIVGELREIKIALRGGQSGGGAVPPAGQQQTSSAPPVEGQQQQAGNGGQGSEHIPF